jgi:hypothetical protein
MKKNIWLIVGITMFIGILVIVVIQQFRLITSMRKTMLKDVSMSPPETSIAVAMPTLMPTQLPTSTLPLISQTPPSTPTPTESIPTPTLTPMPTLTLISTSTSELPTPSPDAARRQLAPFDQWMQKCDELVRATPPEELGQDECTYVTLASRVPRASGACWIYRVGVGNMVFVEETSYAGIPTDLYAYYLTDDAQPEILKWDLGRDRQIDVIEYDLDGDEVLDFALCDTNASGQFDVDEIYMNQSTKRLWRPLDPNALPFPGAPPFPGVWPFPGPVPLFPY